MINKDYLHTQIYSNINDFCPKSGSIYIYGYSTENRSHSVDELKSKCPDVTFVEIQSIDDEKDTILNKSTNEKYYLRNSNSIISLYESYNSSIVYIDTSGLNNRISASLLKNAVNISENKNFEIKVVYAEPYAYKIPRFKSEGVFNDLSEEIEGIEPLPGFASIIPDTIDMKFIALLGFEGGRFTHLVENIQPPSDNIIPVVGVPGFRIEYPFVALWGNRQPLGETKSWDKIKYVAANSLVDVFLLLTKIVRKTPDTKLILAPIGTKPHAIGAILFAIKYPKQVEIVYDNPKRKTTRTDGIGRIVECNINSLLKES
jgi:hypothetical protein